MREKWISQYDESVPGAGPTACFRTCREICRRGWGVTIPDGTARRFQLALSENADGLVDGVNHDETEAANAYMLQCFKDKKPVVVGINYKRGSMNRDHITDHYLVMCEVADINGLMEIRGLNPGAEIHDGADFNVAFRWSEQDGMWRRSWPIHLGDTTISMVVPDIVTAASLQERL